MLVKSSFIAFLAASGTIVYGQTINNQGPKAEVYYLSQQRDLNFGGVFNLMDGSSKANLEGFQLAEAFSCAVRQVEKLNWLPGRQFFAQIRDDRNEVAEIDEVAIEFGRLNVVTPVVSVGQEKLDSFFNTMQLYKAPVFAYMPPGTLTEEDPSSKDLLFAAPVDSYQSKPLIALARIFKKKRFAAVVSDDQGMKDLLDAFKDDGNLFPSQADKVQVICQLNWKPEYKEDDKGALSTFADCVTGSNIESFAIFSKKADVVDQFSKLDKLSLFSNTSLILGSNTWTNQETFDELVSAGISSSILNDATGAIPVPGADTLFRSCLSERKSTEKPYDNYDLLFEAAMKCKIEGNYPVCAVGRNLNEASAEICKCNPEVSLDGMLTRTDVSVNPGINYVMDSVFVSAHAFAQARANCEDTAALINANTTVFCSRNETRQVEDPITKQVSSRNVTLSGKITGRQIAELTRKLVINGLTGKVQFMDNYRRFASYDLKAFNATSQKFEFVGSWSIPENLDEMFDAVQVADVYGSGKINATQKQPIITYSRWNSPEGIAVAFVASLGLICTLFATGFVVVCREHPVIKRASPLFCALMLVGISMLYLQLYLWIGQQTQAICIAKIWVPIVGFGVVMGPLLAKTFRIWKIFDNSKLRARRLLNGHLLGMSGLVVGINVILLIIWTALDPIKPISVLDQAGNTYFFCGSYNNNLQLGFIIAFSAYNGLLLVLGSFLSYKTRSVVSSFNESTFIAYTMYSFLLCFVVLLPIYYTVASGDNPEYPRAGQFINHYRAFVIRSISFIFATTACLVILFGPKFYHVIKGTEDKGDLTSNAASGKKVPVSSKAGSSAPTGAKTSTLVNGGATTGATSSTGDASRPGATVGEVSGITSSVNGAASNPSASVYVEPTVSMPAPTHE